MDQSQNFKGAIIEESLENMDVLKKVKILETEIVPYSEKLKTPWVKQWTIHTVEVPEKLADDITKEISESLDKEHVWYADFKNDKIHYLIFRNRVFKIDVTNKEQYAEAVAYGISLGIPDYQLDFVPTEIIK